MPEIAYPSVERLIEFNLLVLTIVPAKRSDKAKVVSRPALIEVVEECKKEEGDIYSKAAVLLRGLIRRHPFASGNRRTAFVAVKDFLVDNGASFAVGEDPSQARVMLGIREGFYTIDEITGWIKHGKIRPFKR